MKKILFTALSVFLFFMAVYSQDAEPGISGTSFMPNTIEVGQTTDLIISFSNSGTTPIPVGSIEVTISTPDNYYTSDGITLPSGTAGDLFNWVYLGTDVWRGTNTAEFPSFGGGTITLQVTGNTVTTAYEAATINVQPTSNFASFTNATANDNLTAELRIVPASAIENSTDSEEICVTIDAAVWLEGAYEKNRMQATLNEKGYLPGQSPSTFLGTATGAGQPYHVAPWNYTGTEGNTMNYRTIGTAQAGYPATAVDWVLVSLRTGIDRATTVCTRAALVHTDGQIRFLAGRDCCALATAEPYYLVIEHRNHLIVMSPQPLPVKNGTITYDFRRQDAYKGLFGFGQKQVEPGVYAMYTGNSDQESGNYGNRIVNIATTDKDKWFAENGEHSSYYFNDFDMNGDVNVQDKHLLLENNGKFSDVKWDN